MKSKEVLLSCISTVEMEVKKKTESKDCSVKAALKKYQDREKAVNAAKEDLKAAEAGKNVEEYVQARQRCEAENRFLEIEKDSLENAKEAKAVTREEYIEAIEAIRGAAESYKNEERAKIAALLENLMSIRREVVNVSTVSNITVRKLKEAAGVKSDGYRMVDGCPSGPVFEDIVVQIDSIRSAAIQCGINP